MAPSEPFPTGNASVHAFAGWLWMSLVHESNMDRNALIDDTFSELDTIPVHPF